MKWICADSVALGREAFTGLADVELVPETEIDAARVRDADAVITRSKTRLDRALLEGSGVRFAGTCTAGTDHIDFAALDALGIATASAPGCNANAVSEYVVAALLEAHAETGWTFRGKTVGIIGHGQVGTRVDRKLAALGCRILRHDPPKEDRGEPGPFVDLDTLLRASDVVTLHVPLVEAGPHPTRKLLHAERVSRLKPGAVVLNACRGEAVDADALCAARTRGDLSWLVLDVWDPEPEAPVRHMEAADLATPHIAGHSVEGKVNGTLQIRREACRFFGLADEEWEPEPFMPAPVQPVVSLPESGSFEARLRHAVRACYEIRMDDRMLREGAPPVGPRFNRQRRSYRDRREFAATRVEGLRAEEDSVYRALGFSR